MPFDFKSEVMDLNLAGLERKEKYLTCCRTELYRICKHGYFVCFLSNGSFYILFHGVKKKKNPPPQRHFRSIFNVTCKISKKKKKKKKGDYQHTMACDEKSKPEREDNMMCD